jgi:allantoin racemase
VLGHFQEPGLLEIRGSLDIPVIGLGESNLLAALSLGYRFGLVTIDPIFIPWHDRQLRAHGLADRYVGTTALKMNLSSFVEAFTDENAYSRARDDFVAQVKPLIAAGPRSLSRQAECRCCCSPANVLSSSRDHLSERWWPRPPKWRWR